jgi:hypothetical protein
VVSSLRTTTLLHEVHTPGRPMTIPHKSRCATIRLPTGLVSLLQQEAHPEAPRRFLRRSGRVAKPMRFTMIQTPRVNHTICRARHIAGAE